jgi:DNA-binding transcriptional LysR family regulator
MDFRQIRHLIALAEQGSYSKACESVHISQSALSRSIQQLEQQLGITLFERGRFGAVLTAYGQIVLPHMRGMIAAEESLTQTIESVKNLRSGELAIGTGPYPALTIITQAAARFVDRYPDIRLTLRTDDWAALRQALLENEIDLFIADISEMLNDPLLAIDELTPVAGLVICRKGHPLAMQDSVSWSDVLQYPFAMPRLTAEIEQFFQQTSLPFGGLKRRIECNNIALLMEIVSQSDAVSMAPENTIDGAFGQGRLTTLNVSDLHPLQTAYGLVTRRQTQPSPAAAAFRDILLSGDQLSTTRGKWNQ